MFQKATRNQLGNVKNGWQGKPMKVLFVCSAGLLRSPTGANVGYREYGWNTRSCGSTLAFALIPLTEALIFWADRIVFVNQDNFNEALTYAEEFLKGKEVQILDIPDTYGYDDVVLQSCFEYQLDTVAPFIFGEENVSKVET